MAPQSSPSSPSYGFTYDVFLSFRGADTRYGFTGNLFKALDGDGIHTFIDDRELHGGDEITPSLRKAIEESRIFIPVFSINYASSSFCLDELVHIMEECSKAKGRLVLPVFYGVDPSHVRHQTGSYGKAIAKHEKRFQNKDTHLINILLVLFLLPLLLYSFMWVTMKITLLLLLLLLFFLQNNNEDYTDNIERLRKWKMALTQAANLSGRHFNPRDGYEHEVVRKIVKEVSKKINRVPLHVADYPVGLKSRVLHVKSLLDERFDDGVHKIGICGTGGVGKTTIAKAIYNVIANQFECLCFLHNVRENSAKHDLKHLQEMLLSETVGLDIKLADVSKGIPIIKQRLHRKKVLLILDDVDKLEQLQVLAGGLDWFGLGSKIIITTRDKHLLASHEIERTYEVDGLNEEEALELLRWKAFKNNRVDLSYEHILNRAVAYASGLPLAIEIVGSDLFGKPIEHWKSALDRYGKIPNKEIQKILKVSFDALAKDEQSVFLDIACCFKGQRLAEVEDILHAHYGDNMKYHIEVLVEKSLIKIDMCGWSHTNYGHVTLHDLIEDMGKEIVRQESPKVPGKRSRLWFHEDIIEVLEDNTGTSQIEMIYLSIPSFEVVEWKGDELEKMKNLKTLIIKNGSFSKGPKYLPNSLRVLEWASYPSQNMPSDFCPKKLTICKLPESSLTSFDLHGSLKRFVNIKEINLNHCQSLTQIPDVSGLQNLEILSFQNCENLLTVHDSVGFLNKLKILDAQYCRKLESFPPLKLTSLRKLELSGCMSLISFPKLIGEMKNVTSIYFLEEFPCSVEHTFEVLTAEHLEIRLPSSISMMPKLSEIFASSGRILLPKDSDKLSSMVSRSVRRLSLTNWSLSDEFLPMLFTRFVNVQVLILCKNDFTILPECLKACRFLQLLFLDDCEFLQEIRGIPPNLKRLSARHCKSLTSSCRSMLLSQELHQTGIIETTLAGTERIPKWIEHQSKGPSISFWFRNEFPSIALFFVTGSMRSMPHLRVHLKMNGYKMSYTWESGADQTYLLDLNSRHQWGLESILEKGNEWIHAEVRLEGEFGIHIFNQKSSMEDVRFTNPSLYKKRELDDDGGHYSHPYKNHHLPKKLIKKKKKIICRKSIDLWTWKFFEAEFEQLQHRMPLLSLQH